MLRLLSCSGNYDGLWDGGESQTPVPLGLSATLLEVPTLFLLKLSSVQILCSLSLI